MAAVQQGRTHSTTTPEQSDGEELDHRSRVMHLLMLAQSHRIPGCDESTTHVFCVLATAAQDFWNQRTEPGYRLLNPSGLGTGLNLEWHVAGWQAE